MINHSSDSLIPEVEGRRFKSGFWDSKHTGAGWSSLVARRAHNPKVVGSNPAPATNLLKDWYIVGTLKVVGSLFTFTAPATNSLNWLTS